MASASLLKNTEPDLGFFRLRLAAYSLLKPTLRSFDRLGQHEVGSRPPPSGVMLPHRHAYKPSGILAGGHQADCYKLLPSCILASVLDKGQPAAR
jgi:hypothetical protein